MFETKVARRGVDTFKTLMEMIDNDMCHSVSIPKINAKEVSDCLVIKAELPGCSENEIDISIDKGILSIKSCKKNEKSIDKETYFIREISSKDFVKNINIGEDYDGKKAKANYVDGILTLTIPKKEKNKPLKIKIQ